MRLVYLDEAGISRKETALSVAGVMIHGDTQAKQVEDRIGAIIDEYIPPYDRLGFVFHATDLFHGSRYFDRRVWPDFLRAEILHELVKIVEDLRLPVVASSYVKDGFGLGVFDESSPDHKQTIMHTVAAMDCVIRADQWLAEYAAEENALVIAEDTDRVKPMIKTAIRILRSAELMDIHGLSEVKDKFGLPLKRITDTVLFAAKPDARALQLADVCAFVFGRAMKQKDVPVMTFNVIWRHMSWAFPAELISRLKESGLPMFG